MPDFRKFIIVILLLIAEGFLTPVMGRSAYAPRQSGLEPPGSPKTMHVLPGKSPVTTPDGGKGYIDAYGNPVKMPEQEEQKARRRLRPGAYGYGARESSSRTPAGSLSGPETPLWNFQQNTGR